MGTTKLISGHQFDIFSSLQTFLFNFGMVNRHFFDSNYFWGTTSTASAVQLVLLQEDSDDRSTGFYTFLH